MAMYEPVYLPPNAEEQDFIQAYENVREKYKGGSGKHRPKETKKKNKQRLRFRAQNQHSDHLASARSSQ